MLIISCRWFILLYSAFLTSSRGHLSFGWTMNMVWVFGIFTWRTLRWSAMTFRFCLGIGRLASTSHISWGDTSTFGPSFGLILRPSTPELHHLQLFGHQSLDLLLCCTRVTLLSGTWKIMNINIIRYIECSWIKWHMYMPPPTMYDMKRNKLHERSPNRYVPFPEPYQNVPRKYNNTLMNLEHMYNFISRS